MEDIVDYKYCLCLKNGRIYEINSSTYELMKSIIQDDKTCLKNVTINIEEKSFNNIEREITFKTIEISSVEKCFLKKE